jgi:hypothetical protein
MPRAVFSASLHQELHSLARQLDLAKDDTRDVAARLRQAGDIASSNRVEVHRGDHDRTRGGGLPSGLQRDLRPGSHDDVNIQAHELGGEGGKPSDIASSVPELDDEILALDVPQLAQTLDHGLVEGRGPRIDRGKDSDGGHPSRCLRLGGERRGEEAAREDRHEGTSGHVGRTGRIPGDRREVHGQCLEG